MNKKPNYYYKKMPDNYFFVDIFQRNFSKHKLLFDNHWHEHIQFIYFVKGQASIICDSEKINVTTNDFIIINSNEIHYGESLSTNVSFYVIRVDFSFLFSNSIDSCQTKFMLPLSQNMILFKNLIKNDATILECINDIIYEYFKKETGFELAIKSYIYKLLVILIRNYTQRILTEKQLNSKINNLNRFNKTLKYINENFNKKININKLSHMAHISNYYFCRLFKQATGKTPIEYINLLRIKKANVLLQKNILNITEIALACGFSNSNYFSRIYKRINHISPSQYKILIKN